MYFYVQLLYMKYNYCLFIYCTLSIHHSIIWDWFFIFMYHSVYLNFCTIPLYIHSSIFFLCSTLFMHHSAIFIYHSTWSNIYAQFHLIHCSILFMHSSILFMHYSTLLMKCSPICLQFCFESCKFKIQKSKEGTGRIVMWNMGIMNSYTLEVRVWDV